MITMASQITSVSIVYSTVCWGGEQRKYQSSASLVIGELPSQRASEAEKVSIWLRDHFSQVSEWRLLCQVTCTITFWSLMQIEGESRHRLIQCSMITLLSIVQILYIFYLSYLFPVRRTHCARNGHYRPDFDATSHGHTFRILDTKYIHLPLAILLSTCAQYQY